MMLEQNILRFIKETNEDILFFARPRFLQLFNKFNIPLKDHFLQTPASYFQLNYIMYF